MSQHYDNSATINVQLISIHAPREGRDLHGLRLLLGRDISIHAPRAGRDPASAGRDHRRSGISIHAPRAGRDWSSGDKGCRHGISIHAPRAGRDILIEVDGKTVVISIHAPHAGRDRKSYPCRMGGSTYFNPRAPCGARPLVPGIYQLLKNHFNPRTPCGARRQIHQDHRLTMEFQSTRPMRGATWSRP